MQAQQRLLLDALDADEAHVRLHHRGTDRLGIIGVVLRRQALAKRPHELRRHEPRLVPELLELARPMMRTRARFHPHHAEPELGQQRQ